MRKTNQFGAIFARAQSAILRRLIQRAQRAHFVEDYTAWVRSLLASYPRDEAMARAVGGAFKSIGGKQREVLRMYGLKNGMSVIDLACGSGRTASALSKEFELRYLGIDVVPELIGYAASITPAAYRYAISTDLTIPAADESVDMVFAFSLFTHLLHEETYLYLEEIKRVLKPGGKLVFSFLEFRNPQVWDIFYGAVIQARRSTKAHLNIFIEQNAIRIWADHLGLHVDAFLEGEQNLIRLSKPVETDEGGVLEGMTSLGQSICVLSKC